MEKIFKIFNHPKLLNVKKEIDKVYLTFYEYRKNKKILLITYIISIIYQIAMIIMVYLLALSIDIDISFSYYLIFLPLIWLIIMIPISISGIGVREGAFVYFFTQIDVPKENSLLLSLLFFSQTIIVGLVGGFVYLIRDIGDRKNDKNKKK